MHSLSILAVQRFKNRHSASKFFTHKKKLNDFMKCEKKYVNKQNLNNSLELFKQSRIVVGNQ